jgi:hypothetical protein
MNILVLGAGGNAGINFIKCLKHYSRQDIIVHGADMNKYYRLAGNADFWAPINYDSDAAKIESIHEYVDRHDIAMIHAQPDAEVRFLLSYQSEFSRLLFNHSLQVFDKFSDKHACQKIWGNEFGNFQVCRFDEALADPRVFEGLRDLGHGTVWFRAIRGAGSRCALPVDTMEQAKGWAMYWQEKKGMNHSDFMLCEYLPGPEYAVQTFWYDGVLMHSQARERLVPFFGALMPSGQTSTPAVARTVNTKKVYLAAYKAIKAIDPSPHGIYCVDLKTTGDDKTIVPTEVNYGRFFTTCDFFAALGVNTPVAYVNSHVYGIRKKKVECVEGEHYWIRGLDKEPRLITNYHL